MLVIVGVVGLLVSGALIGWALRGWRQEHQVIDLRDRIAGYGHHVRLPDPSAREEAYKAS